MYFDKPEQDPREGMENKWRESTGNETAKTIRARGQKIAVPREQPTATLLPPLN
jgi:hypothetical protein